MLLYACKAYSLRMRTPTYSIYESWPVFILCITVFDHVIANSYTKNFNNLDPIGTVDHCLFLNYLAVQILSGRCSHGFKYTSTQ